jgi:chemotaxis protein methyltransferase CheR
MTGKPKELQLTVKEFKKIARLVFESSGINLGPIKKVMVESRLQKRMRALGFSVHSDYCDYLFSEEGLRDELQPMLDVITTNKTDFFREPHHFDFLYRTGLAELSATFRGGRPLRIWSAGCSSGEEPYSIAILLQEFRENVADLQHEILATDISTKVLNKACLGIYDRERISELPISYKLKYFLKSRDPQKKVVRVVPDVRSLVEYRYFNLIYDDMDEMGLFDVIFCRNVIIYFDNPTKKALLQRLHEKLLPGGFLFLGHSETINGMDLAMEQVGSTIYRKPASR